MDNPFKYGGVVSGPYFADREREMAELVREMVNLSRVFLISPRRFGKTCLLHRLREHLEEKGVASAYLDLNAYPDISSFAAAFAHLASLAIESNTERLLKLFAGLKRLRPRVFVAPDGSIAGGLETVAGEPDARPLSRDFQLAHGIGPSSSIKASLESLNRRGILQKTREGGYRFADLFMRHWLLGLGEPQR